jgi:hypothetical protein
MSIKKSLSVVAHDWQVEKDLHILKVIYNKKIALSARGVVNELYLGVSEKLRWCWRNTNSRLKHC